VRSKKLPISSSRSVLPFVRTWRSLARAGPTLGELLKETSENTTTAWVETGCGLQRRLLVSATRGWKSDGLIIVHMSGPLFWASDTMNARYVHFPTLPSKGPNSLKGTIRVTCAPPQKKIPTLRRHARPLPHSNGQCRTPPGLWETLNLKRINKPELTANGKPSLLPASNSQAAPTTMPGLQWERDHDFAASQ